jgi:hypothetical protein
MAAAANKTQATQASVAAYLAERGSAEQIADCQQLISMMQKITAQTAVMWGPSIVGFDRYTYRYESGRSGDACVIGFAIRGRELVIYLLAETAEQQGLLAKLGKHRFGKSCLYFKRLQDLDADVLQALMQNSVTEIKRRYP